MPITGRLARQYSYRCDCSDNTQGLKPHEMFTMAVLANADTEEGDNDAELAEDSDTGKANLEDYLEALKQATENARPIVGIKIGEYSALATKDEEGNVKKDANGYNILVPEKKGEDFIKYTNETYWIKGHLETFGFVKVENAVWSTL